MSVSRCAEEIQDHAAGDDQDDRDDSDRGEPNTRADMIVVATMPPAHHVAYATPRSMRRSAFENA